MSNAIHLREVEKHEELIYLANALETIVFISVSTLDNENISSIAEARRDLSRFTADLTHPTAVDSINLALKSEEGVRRVNEELRSIENAASAIEKIILEIIGREIFASSLRRAFVRGSILLLAQSSRNKAWWCSIYGIRKILC